MRAAAVVSAIALGLAGLLFFKYSIEHGLFPPWLRVVLGTMVGIASVAGSELALRRRYAGTANALAGGGLVVLYAAFWAASVRYELIGLLPGFVLMAAVTVSGCVLAWRHETELTAILALAGGFATPLLLASGTDRPFGLFGYLLMLDACLIYLATNRGWPRIAMLGLLGTVLYQAGWIGSRMGPERLWLGLGILGVFAFAFIAGTRRAASEKAPEWRITQAAAILLPFVFALYFAVDVRFAPSVLPVGLLLILLSVAAGWLARAQHAYELSLGAAAAGLGVLILWCAAPQPPLDPAWQLIAVAVGLAVVFHGFVELESRRSDWEGPAAAAVLAAVGQCGVLALAMTRAPDTVWPWVGGLTLLAAALVRHASLPERDVLGLVSPVLVALFLGLLSASHGGPRGTLAPVAFQALALAAAAAYQAVALWRGAKGSPPWAEHGAGACAGFLTAVCVSAVSNAPPAAFLGTTLALGLMMALVSARVASGAWLLAAVVMTTVAHAAFADTRHVAADADLGLAAGAAGVLVFTAWPFMAGSRLRADRFAWHAAALAGPLWFWPLRSLFVERFGDAAIGVLPLMLGAVALLAAFKARDSLRGAEPVRTPALAWLAAVALGFVSVAIPLQLEKSWITIGWALEGVAVLYLWTRLDHVGLKYFGLLLLAAVTVRLVTNVEVLMYYPRPAWRIVNWLMYTYLVPAAALLGSAQVLRRFELVRANSWERENVYHRGIALGAIGCGLAALGVIFVWLNLAIADWFATGQTLTLSFERLPARDLTTSIVWALYALILLGIGMARASIGLRWVSLGLLIVTNAKVFLHDLGELRDLYRVASLVGLAISLLAVSLAYQRFVFREVPGQEKT
ncbi:MAG: DUF2339 domain-containing protein [Deltaproteobacteria bacterium]|nr:DUF2339 domain-containing protein [Deltaproteobacteria bacterium]